MSRSKIVSQIIEQKVVAVVRMNDHHRFLKVAEALLAGGINTLEVTMTVPNALEVISICRQEFGDSVNVGVGSVLETKTAERAINAGAQYIVSPIFKPDIIKVAHKYSLPAMPGCLTPTEVYAAWECGADIIKVFPANVVGMAFFKAILAPIPGLRLMPTGGVSLSNAGEWLQAGACAVGVGSALLEKQAISDGNYRKLSLNAEKIMQSVQSAD